MPEDGGFNHNDHYHRFLLKHLPPHIGTALDIGCGKGEFARLLAQRTDHVTGIDLSPKMLEAASALSSAFPNIDYALADMMVTDYPADSFDCIASIATLHHLPLDAALKRIKAWLKPGGTLLILDLVSMEPRYLWQDALSIPLDQFAKLRRGKVTPPSAESRAAWDQHGQHDHYPKFSDVKHICADLLPGAKCTRHLFWRYSVVWKKP